ncbi:SAL1 phosphatase, partial [Bienertia sinuspersici]
KVQTSLQQQDVTSKLDKTSVTVDVWFWILYMVIKGTKVVLGVLACLNLPLAPLGLQSSVGQNGCLFSAIIGEATYIDSMVLLQSMSILNLNVNPTANTDEASFFELYEAAQSSHDLSISIAKLGLIAQKNYGALSRGNGVIYFCFAYASYGEKIWDHVARFIVVIEGGGVVSNAAENSLDFSKEKYNTFTR